MTLEQLSELERYIQHHKDVALAAKAFAVPELLENILKHLPCKNLFIIMRVDRTFCDLIKVSPTVHRSILIAYQQSLRLSTSGMPIKNPQFQLVPKSFSLALDRVQLQNQKPHMLKVDFLNTYSKVDWNLQNLVNTTLQGSRRFTNITAYLMTIRICF